MNKLERKLGRFAIPNLYIGIIGCFVIGYIFRYLATDIYNYLTLIPYSITVQGQYWRLFTWIFTVPFELGSRPGISMIFLPISIFFYYFCAKRLEQAWGRFQFNLYVIGGALLTDIVILLASFMYYNWLPNAAQHRTYFQQVSLAIVGQGYNASSYLSLDVTYYMLISIFLAFTVIAGDGIVYLYFILPVKMKWLGYLDLLWLGYYFVRGDSLGLNSLFIRLAILVSVVNYFIYFLSNRNRSHATFQDRMRQRKFQNAVSGNYVKSKQIKRKSDGSYNFRNSSSAGDSRRFHEGPKIITPGFGNPAGISIHKCAICGRTENDDPNLEFRFCSKCNGNYEYCSDHLYTHQHVQ